MEGWAVETALHLFWGARQGTIPQATGVALMTTRCQPALDPRSKRPENFANALRLLLGDCCEDRGARLRAKGQLDEMIRWIESDFTDPERPPRVSEVRQMLRETRKAANDLRRAVLQFSALLSSCGSFILPSPLVDRELHESLEASMLYGAHDAPEMNASLLYEALVGIDKFCRRFDEKLLPKGLRGRVHMLSGKLQSPKTRLATDAGWLFVDWRPTELTGTVGGPFYNFCAEVYELVTGEQPEEPGGGLKRYVEFVAPRIRRLNAMLNHRIHLNLIRPPHLYGPRIAREIDRLSHEMAVLSHELDAGPFHRALA